MKVLLIGINSFTGQSLAEHLQKQSFTVFGTNKNNLPSNFIFPCDITKKSEIEATLNQIQPDYIINFAGISFVAHSDPFELYKVNAFAVESLLQACLTLEKKPKKIILVSSSIVYGTQAVTELSEELLPKPQNHYGLSKFCMETIASWYADRLNIIITRPFNYTGINQSKQFLIPKIIDHFKRKAETIELGNINVYREFNGIDFICDVYCKFLQSDITSGVYNVCTGRGYCIDDMLKLMHEMSGHQIDVIINPALVRENEIEYLVGSPVLLRKSLGELRTESLEAVLEKMYNQYNCLKV